MTSPMAHLMLNFMTVAGGTQQSGRPNRIKRKYPFSMPISGRQNNGKTFGEQKIAMSVFLNRSTKTPNSGHSIECLVARQSIECLGILQNAQAVSLSIECLGFP